MPRISDRPAIPAAARNGQRRDEAGQARWVADQVLAQAKRAPRSSQAALFRSASHSAALELELTRRNIPFVKFGGLRFWRRPT